MHLEHAHRDLMASVLTEPLTEEDALLWMTLLHTHEIQLVEPLLDDCPGMTTLAAITQRHTADIIADLWPDRQDRERTNYVYWYHTWLITRPAEFLDEVKESDLSRLLQLREQLMREPRIKAVVEEL